MDKTRGRKWEGRFIAICSNSKYPGTRGSRNIHNMDETRKSQVSNMDEAIDIYDKGTRLAIRKEELGKTNNIDEAIKRAWMKQTTWMKPGNEGKKQASINAEKHR